MKYKKILIVLAMICVIFSGCDSTAQKILSNKLYQYSISTTFDSQADKETFENRLSIFDIDIVNIGSDDNMTHYTLRSSYIWFEDHFELLGRNFEAFIVDESGNSLLTDTDILRVLYDGTSLKIYTSVDYTKKLQDEYDIRALRLKIGDTISNANLYFDDEECLSFIMGPGESENDLYKAAIAFGKSFLTTEIKIDVLPSE